MFQVPSLAVLLGLTLSIFLSHKAKAQQVSESGVVYEAARNKIGLIRYCRDNGLLARTVADQAVAAIDAYLRNLPTIDPASKELGDRAQKAGEDGFWDAGRRRDIVGIADLFRTTPTSLCQEWAGETLRQNATAIPVIAPIQPNLQAKPTAVEPVQDYKPPVRNTAAVVKPPRPVQPSRTLPEKAPLLPVRAEPSPAPRPTRNTPTSAPGTIALGTSAAGTLVIPPNNALPPPRETPLREAAPIPARVPGETLPPLPREQTVTATIPPRELDDEPTSPIWGKLPVFNQLGKRGRCLMAGCKW